jgi:Flp pilus assembly pilin Flp
MKLNSRGQALIEYTLLLGLVLVAWMGTTKVLNETGFFQKLFGDPWTRISTTIEFGVPSGSRQDAGPRHPASFERHASVRPNP